MILVQLIIFLQGISPDSGSVDHFLQGISPGSGSVDHFYREYHLILIELIIYLQGVSPNSCSDDYFISHIISDSGHKRVSSDSGVHIMIFQYYLILV